MSAIHDLDLLLEEASRRRLTASEREFVVSSLRSGAQREQFELDQRLVAALEGSRPVASSNFTSGVLAKVRREEAAVARKVGFSTTRSSFVSRWLPRLAFGCLLLTAGYFSYEKVTLQKRTEMAQSVAIIAAPPLPPAVLQDFDAIEAMSTTPAADEQLLALMQ